MFETIFEGFVQIALDTVASWGYWGILILMTIESTIIPFPAEIILIPAGALVAQGTFSFFGVLVAATVGSVAGALINYGLAYYLGRRPFNALIHRYGKLLFIDEKTVIKTEEYFTHHGHITTFIGRLIPGVRSFISLPAGFARMNVVEFSVFTALGAGIWSALLIVVGYLLGDNLTLIKSHLDSLSITLIVISIIIGFVYWKKSRR